MTHAQAQAISNLINNIDATTGWARLNFTLSGGWRVVYHDPATSQETALRSVQDFYRWLGRQGYALAR
jgi:hypothetical protein